ncbi:MAG: hypothetical protein QNK27_07860 [Desulfuromusa sp.]|nr:hypothetical protein [Desulfuromusa sp.]
MGLGLSISNGIIEAHGGKLAFTNPTGGERNSLSFYPCIRIPEAMEKHTPTVFVVDDDAEVRNVTPGVRRAGCSLFCM